MPLVHPCNPGEVTDGWNWRQSAGGSPGTPGTPHPAPPTVPLPGPVPPSPPPVSGSPWWSDALRDPWRDPHAPAAVVVQPGSTGAAAPEPVTDPDLAPRRGLGVVVLISVLSALLAGALGGALGYAFAVRGGAGGGFVVTADGYVITNDHVVGETTGKASVMFSDGSTASAEVVGKDPESDIAVIKVDKTGLQPVELGDSDAIAVGDPVLAFGSPLALANTVTAGIVSAVDRTIEANENGGPVRYYAAIQTDAPVNQGNSGGPLDDGGGRVVGVNSVIRSVGGSDTEAGNIGLAFAIPINQARRVAEDIIDTGKARRTVIGATIDNSVRSPGGGARL